VWYNDWEQVKTPSLLVEDFLVYFRVMTAILIKTDFTVLPSSVSTSRSEWISEKSFKPPEFFTHLKI
jgi:hypothetical protein